MAGHKNSASTTLVDWSPCWRLISSRFPPAGLYDRVADQEDLDIVCYIEGLTNDRLRDEMGEISLVPENERIFGNGASPIMAAFTHLNPQGSRFTDGSYGVYYAAKDIDTALAETSFHKIRFLSATNEPAIEIDMLSYTSDINIHFHDIRGMQTELPDIYVSSPTQYSHPQAFAKELRNKSSNGIVYDSVRHEGGECVAIFRPNILSPAKQGKHYCYVWDGNVIIEIYEKRKYLPTIN